MIVRNVDTIPEGCSGFRAQNKYHGLHIFIKICEKSNENFGNWKEILRTKLFLITFKIKVEGELLPAKNSLLKN